MKTDFLLLPKWFSFFFCDFKIISLRLAWSQTYYVSAPAMLNHLQARYDFF